MSNNNLPSYCTISSNDDPGSVQTNTGSATFTAIAVGAYKIAAMGSGMLWKLGTDVVTQATGSFLAAGDQEVIIVQTATTLSWILDAFSTTDGSINIVPVELYSMPLGDLRKAGV